MIRAVGALLAIVLAGCDPAPSSPSGCGSCHADAPAGVHATLPCTTCHLGHAEAATKEEAHAGIEAEPGALDTVDRTCGLCHAEEVARVRTVPMTTGRGIIGVDRFVFGESPTPDTEATLAEVLRSPDPSPADDHVRRLCAGCHLGDRKANRDDVRTGGSGCGACHAGAAPSGHSSVDSKVGDDRCFGCHSRSARIALTYAGKREGPCAETLPDGRTLCDGEPDVHAKAGMACIDCHVHTELMGDGVSRAHQEEQVEVRCVSCHGAPPAPVNAEDPVTRRLPQTGSAATGVRGTPLWNVKDGVLTGKLDGRTRTIRTVAADHAGRGHDRLECVACHAAVAPTCVTCHTRYEPGGEQWDFGAGKVTPGRWHEDGAPEVLAAPALGVDGNGRIRPAIPGMIAEIEGRALRRFALLDPHATRATARTCADCHQGPTALGLGSGTLDPATFRFTPVQAVPGRPDLATDGWTSLGSATPGEGTRVGSRSLDTSEQRRVLRVGVCLGCHDGASIAAWPDLETAPRRCTQGRGWWNSPETNRSN